ncbi:sensor histidine kinase [Pseudonocardia abyssalis]|uniref:histidine kinase n=1 Tax=Pseudonocardia abyssalis TaxID=2792008 RepID=A0ABS6UNP9_9PSEU|nr:sensor histidine kinase [Pseudonocardia abyssalis]MBW0116039.1 sensor histidine kinase [Pseudonocardia abyssalis]MBW0133881.1 sensor histidine kinase [Pseudonocardia abyssalis]
MVGGNLRALWAEPRPAHPPARVWRDRALVAALVSWSVVETVLRQDLAWWRPVVLTLSLVIALALLWRRTHPLGSVVVAFGSLIAFDVARLFAFDGTGLNSIVAVLVLPYSLFRWGAGREAAIGLGMILVWLPVTLAAVPADPAEVVAGYGFFLFSAALGTSIRYHAGARVRDIEQAKLRQRNQLARELHDAVGHHVSAIAIQAQAGRAVAASDPDRALATLETIEETASRTLAEMRAMVGVLRDGTEPDFAPHPGAAAIEQLARGGGGWPRVDVQLSGDLDELNPSVGVALHRIAQEAVTNAVRHARHATRVAIRVADEGERVRLTVRDDGDAGSHTPPGYGLVGMAERASLLGGTLQAGPDPDGGWTVDAVLPKGVATT